MISADRLSLAGMVQLSPSRSANTYRQMGEPDNFADQIEQVLRGTFDLRSFAQYKSRIAQRLLAGIRTYTAYLSQPGQPSSGG